MLTSPKLPGFLSPAPANGNLILQPRMDTDKHGLSPLQKRHSGFRQKAAFFNSQGFAALCRDAATFDGCLCRGLKLFCGDHFDFYSCALASVRG
jgi:hypothetical protein